MSTTLTKARNNLQETRQVAFNLSINSGQLRAYAQESKTRKKRFRELMKYRRSESFRKNKLHERAKILAFQLREEGKTFQEIGKIFGVTASCVIEWLQQLKREKNRQKVREEFLASIHPQ
jgi:DNA invertase Pin-like site-specific DNA recombinase